jgi:hypothetical protein
MKKSDVDSIATLYKSLWANCKATDGTFAEIYNCFRKFSLEEIEQALRDCAYDKSFEPSFAEVRAKIPGAKKKSSDACARYVTATDSEKEEYEQQMLRRGFHKTYVQINSDLRGYVWERNETETYF